MKAHWTEAEERYLLDHWYDYSSTEIARKLGRSQRSVLNKIYKLRHKQKLCTQRKEHTSCFPAGISYQKVLPPEKWPLIKHFLVSLHVYGSRAQELGIRPDIGAYMAEYAGQHPGRRAIDG